MNMLLSLTVLGALYSVALSQEYDGRRPVPLPKPVPFPKPLPHPKPLPRCVKVGTCGGFAGATCPKGSTCRYRPNTDFGDCCRIVGVCPPPSGLITTCQFDPKRNCLSDDTCPPGSRCCSEGCGKVCKSVLKG